MLRKIISGGQTGADIAGLDAAILLHIPTGGTVMKGFKTETGSNFELSYKYGLEESDSEKPYRRTLQNVLDSDGTILFSPEQNSSGTKLTIKLCEENNRPYILVKKLSDVKNFIYDNNISILNVAGNRESVSKDVYLRSFRCMVLALRQPNDVFVFGSNATGSHGAGAALFAKSFWEARNGQAEGLQGRAYGIITKKDFRFPRSSSLEEIRDGVLRFRDFALERSDLRFLVSKIGCGLAGWDYAQIANIFYNIDFPKNVLLPPEFDYRYLVDKFRFFVESGNYNGLSQFESENIRGLYNYELDKLKIPRDFSGECRLTWEDNLIVDRIDRVVVGDHGAYFEFDQQDVKVPLVTPDDQIYRETPKYIDNVKYFWREPKDFPGVKFYLQQKTVGYADYKPGKYYVSVYDLDFSLPIKELYIEKVEKRNDENAQPVLLAGNSPVVKESKKEEKAVQRGDFVHLHVHSCYSLLDGVCQPEELTEQAKKLGHHALALTDHGNVYGLYKFQKACKDTGIKPIHGIEAYYVDDASEKENRHCYHLIILVMNEQGWKNLSKIVTYANFDGFFRKPRVDKQILAKYNEGLIITSACYYSPVSFHLSERGNDPARALSNMRFFKETFGDRFYNEIMHIDFEPYNIIVPELLNMAEVEGVKTIVTNDVHYITKDQAELQHFIININTGGAFDGADGNCYYMKSREELVHDYVLPVHADNTLEIADRIDFKFNFEGYKMPSFDITKTDDYEEFHKHLKEQEKIK